MRTIEVVEKHNKEIDDFINIELAKKLNAKDGKITMEQWFTAQKYIQEQDFYNKGMAILKELKLQGIHVKMNMQSNKLVY